MRLTPRQLNRATLARQLLLRRASLPAVEGVRRVVALQAQEPASPYLALWNRLTGFDPAELDAAFISRTVVKATLMRITLHAVDAGDYPAFHRAMTPTLRASRLYDRRFKQTGLTIADADELLPHVVEFGAKAHTNAEFEALLDAKLGVLPKPGAWWALRTFAPFVHAPTGGPWTFGPRPSYVAAAAQLEPDDLDRDEALRRLAFRYLEGFGPASAEDFAQCTLLTRAVARDAFRALRNELVELEGPGGQAMFDVQGAPLPDEDTPAPARLLGMWDSILLAYADRSRVIPPDYRPLVIRRNGDVLPTLLVDGHVAGVWWPVDGGIEATAFHRLSGEVWDGLEAEAGALVAFLGARDPAVYRRYQRWWDAISGAEVRVLGAEASEARAHGTR